MLQGPWCDAQQQAIYAWLSQAKQQRRRARCCVLWAEGDSLAFPGTMTGCNEQALDVPCQLVTSRLLHPMPTMLIEHPRRYTTVQPRPECALAPAQLVRACNPLQEACCSVVSKMPFMYGRQHAVIPVTWGGVGMMQTCLQNFRDLALQVPQAKFSKPSGAHVT